jgi:signal transduction histidine kinase
MAMSKMQRRINQQAWTMRLFENDQDEQKVIKQLAEANVNAACIMAELEEARDKAQEADRAKGNFLANITHELRTPLVAIMGFAEIMRDDLASDPEHSEFLSCIYNNGQDLLEILDSILLMTLLDSDELEVMPVSSNPYKLFRRVLQNHVGKAVENGLIIHLHDCVDAQIPKVLQIDEKWVEQILNRLVHNALKFTPNGHIDLSLNWSETPTGHRLHFAVKDTGIGINPQAMPSIFEPFTQADNSASRSYGGLGLGLAISRKLARALGGDIHVSSVPGQGSFFELVLNFAEQQDVVPA